MLAEILPLDSADMWWLYTPGQGKYIAVMHDEPDPHYLARMASYGIKDAAIPCWSLAALLNVLPKPTKRMYELNIYGDEKPFFGFNDCDLNIHKGFEGDNYIDACVNMIVYMHEKLDDF